MVENKPRYSLQESREYIMEVYRDTARRAVANYRSRWWLTTPGYGERSARKMLRADLEAYRYTKTLAKAAGTLPDFKWRFNK